MITGAGAGLGRAYAIMYGSLGANVVVNDVSEKGAKAVANEISAGTSQNILTIFSLPDAHMQLEERPSRLFAPPKTVTKL